MLDNTDCDDTDILTHPGAPELPDDGISQDCDGDDLIMSDETGVFVATTGDDANLGTMALPLLTINAGTALALQEGKSVFIAQGDYTEDVETHVSVFGGYESAGWTRDIEGYTTTIYASTSTAVSIGDTASIAVQGFTIDGGEPDNYSCYGVSNYGTATLVNNVIDGGSTTFANSNSYGVNNFRGTATLANNTINGGSATGYSGESYSVRNYYGTVMLVNNTIDGGLATYHFNGKSFGVDNSSGIATLVNNNINGGSGSDNSRGVLNLGGTATLVNNTIDAGSTSDGISYGVDIRGGTATLLNNVIDGGSGSSSYGVHNGGWLYGSATATLVNNDINGGSGDESYGVYNFENTAALVSNVINGGSGSEGSSWGVYNYDGIARLVNNVIIGGSGSEGSSYGVYNYLDRATATATLVNNVIIGGTGNNSYGVHNYYGTVTLVNNTINSGSGIELNYGVYNDGMATLVNNAIVVGSGYCSYGMYSYFNALATLVNNDIWGAHIDCMIYNWDFGSNTGECQANTIGEVNACEWTDCIESLYNISLDPLFVDPVGGDFHLQNSSRCIDAGIYTGPYVDDLTLVESDFEGDTRPYGAGWDIGADEWTPASK